MEKIRLQKFLALSGIASRRKAEELIQDGKIKVNNSVITKLGTTIDPDKDQVEYRGKPVAIQETKIFAFYKPLGVTSTLFDPHAKQTIKDFFKDTGRLYPVGRLDRDSEGLIIVTNDGDLALTLSHPRYEHEKEYEVIITGRKPENLVGFTKSWTIDGEKFLPMTLAHSEELGQNQYLVTLVLHEGKKRQIRRVASALSFRVLKLKRIRVGKLRLGHLKPGEKKEIKKTDIL